MPPPQVAVCGPRDRTAAEAAWAREVGRLLAEAGVTVLCGGSSGVKAAVAAGARSGGGPVIGIRPDTDRDANRADLSAVVHGVAAAPRADRLSRAGIRGGRRPDREIR